jgi:hypothetical protein
MIEHYFAAEPLIVARVRAQMPALKQVFGMADLATLRDNATQFAPCVCVVYDGDEIPQAESARAGAGAAQVVLQRWVTWLIVRNVREAQRGEATREDAGPLLSSLISALAGWQPEASFRPLRRGPSPRPLYQVGTLHFPVLFLAPLVTVANPA